MKRKEEIYKKSVKEMISFMKNFKIDKTDGSYLQGALYSTLVFKWLYIQAHLKHPNKRFTVDELDAMSDRSYKANLPKEPEIQRLWKILQKKQEEFDRKNIEEFRNRSLMESFNGFASEEDYISLNESLNLKPALDKIKNICARLKKEFGLDCYATEDEVVFNNDDDIMSGLVVKKKYNNLKQYLANVFQVMKLCGRKISFDSQYDYDSILL